MKTTQRSAGFGVIEIILVVVVLAIIGLVGYRAWDANRTADTGTTTEQSRPAEKTPENQAPQIKEEEDLTTAEESLDNTDIEGNSEAEFNEQTNF